MAVLAIVQELAFHSKIEAAAAHAGIQLRVVTDVAAIPQVLTEHSWYRIVIDLNLSHGDAIETVNRVRQLAPTIPIIGYLSHVQTALQAQAKQAGCTLVLPRSVFVQQLPMLLSERS